MAHSARLRTVRTAAASLLVLALIQLPATVVVAAPQTPQLSIAVDNGRESATARDKITYTTTITNLGAKSVKDLRISQTVPTGVKINSTIPKAKTSGSTIAWTTDIEPGKKIITRATVTVGDSLPPTLLRLATVACAQTSPKGPPLVCASDSDQLPAGAVADRERTDLQHPAAAKHPSWWVIGGSAAAALAFVALGLGLFRRRAHRRAHRRADPLAAIPEGLD